MKRKALKCFSNIITTDADKIRIKRQVDILKCKIHENIIKYLESFEKEIEGGGVRVYLLTKLYQVTKHFFLLCAKLNSLKFLLRMVL